MIDKTGTLTVMGTGSVEVTPDEAIVHLGVLTEGKTAAEAVAVNAKRTQAVKDAVSSEPNHSVTTSGLGVQPVTTTDPGTGIATIVGFRATNGVEVKTKVGYAGQIYDAGVAAGANQSSGITLRVQDEAPHRAEALRKAVADARDEAKVATLAAGVEIKGVESMEIDAGGGPVYFARSVDAGDVTTPFDPANKMIVASVRMMYRIREAHHPAKGAGG